MAYCRYSTPRMTRDLGEREKRGSEVEVRSTSCKRKNKAKRATEKEKERQTE